MSIVIKNGTIVTDQMSYSADVLIQDDRIVEIGDNLRGEQTIDATGCYVMPGGIDPHTHFELPFMGTFTRDDFGSGTRAALAGGTTTIVDFVIPDPQQSLLDALNAWHNKSARAHCDYGFHMAITWWDEQVFDEMKVVVQEKGINTFKHFMAYKGAIMVDDDEMFSSFQRCADLGAMPLVHAENGDVVARLQAKFLAEGKQGPEWHGFSRPPEIEGEATNRAIMIADMTGVPLYVVHTSCEESHEAIRRARQKGMRVYGEPLIQHLVLDDSEYLKEDWDHAARCVMSPPFRNRKHQESLWAGLTSGSLQVVGSDHAAFSTEQKRMGRGDFTKIPNGTGGVEDRLAVLWNEGVNTGRLTMNEFVAVTSSNIARILNMYPRKGAIMVGADADIVVWDPEKKKTISAAAQESTIDYNVFEGRNVKGLPRFVLSHGKVVVDDGHIQSSEGQGRFIPRGAFPAANRALTAWKQLNAPRNVLRSSFQGSGV